MDDVNGHSNGGVKARSQKLNITVFSGGTAANSLVDVFNRIIERKNCELHYVIPISDNGGSSSELIRFVGGPSVGDIRSRLVRLIPNCEGDEEMKALKVLFEHRLSSDAAKAREEWSEIVEGRNLLWSFISSPKRELIRSFLNTLNLELVKRVRPGSVFNFANASIGNMFLTGARIFSGSFESAIYLLSIVCAMPSSVNVLPAINSNHTHHISAGLADGTQVTGQVMISHPSAPTALPDETLMAPALTAEDHDRIEDASLPGSLPVLRRQHITFSKQDEEDLPARIQRLWYINQYGHEIWPVANPKVLDALQASSVIVYCIGSLYTSIVPSLVLRGVGERIAATATTPRHKILLLNSRLDRETGPVGTDPMTARDFVAAIARAAAESWTPPEALRRQGGLDALLSTYVSHLVYPAGLDEARTSGAPHVDVAELQRLGVVCVRVAARTVLLQDKTPMLRYDEAALGEALEAIIDL
ncbi:hypothetical protein B0T24DRAFT_682848 [Lasiosphaeria ovina]|uniref:Uncharacterized protein n=1 Tax=Lasiosphaeria ovina TaxID=92902 RepID=A0AAE0N195_9PEZI|nr:hypothetical protein B0T24DRAFT_682848 [Lasiosphaeria ovina]